MQNKKDDNYWLQWLFPKDKPTANLDTYWVSYIKSETFMSQANNRDLLSFCSQLSPIFFHLPCNVYSSRSSRLQARTEVPLVRSFLWTPNWQQLGHKIKNHKPKNISSTCLPAIELVTLDVRSFSNCLVHVSSRPPKTALAFTSQRATSWVPVT